VHIDGTALTPAPGYINNSKPSQYVIGIGRAKSDNRTERPKVYVDIVLKQTEKRLLLNQWSFENVILKGLERSALDKINLPNNQKGKGQKHRIGHDFVRVGLPKMWFGPDFENLRNRYPKLMLSANDAVGHYWANVS
jgi:hypothetical protein